MSGSEVEGKKKELVKIFKNNGLSITVKTNIKTADFFDIHFDLVKEMMTLCALTKNAISTVNTAASSEINLKKNFRNFIK